jgi:predicted outer membrane repeat protein
VERLEGREVPALFTVTTVSDDRFDPGFTLREAIVAANASPGADTIDFALPANSKIVLNPNGQGEGESTQGPLPAITEQLAITGPGKGTLTVGGAGLVRIFVTNANVPVTISGLTLQNGLAKDGFDGGAILAKGPLTLSGVTLKGNTADTSFSGGAIFSSSSVALDDVLFDSNQAGFNGGAIAFRDLTNSSLSITAAGGPVIFLNNKAGLGGGALSLADAAFTASGVRFESNAASERGGALLAGSSAVAGGPVSITGATFVGNTSSGGGGAVALIDVSGTIANSTFTQNQVTSNSAGGAIDLQQAGAASPLLTIINSTFTSNAATSGGAIAVSTESANTPVLALTHVTVTNNRATFGGGVRNFSGSPVVRVFNSIVAGNFDPMGLVPTDVSGSLQSLGTNLFTTQSGGTGFVASDLVVADPMLGALANNGGPTLTVLPQAGSPALGAANPVGAPASDQRGRPRPSGGVVDIGAVQLQRPTATDDDYPVDGVMATSVPAPGVLANDQANDVSPGLTSSLLTPPPLTFGGVTVFDDGSFTFTPAGGAAGSATFTYLVSDGLTKSSATVTLTIPAPVPPTAGDDTFTLPNVPPNQSTVLAPGVLGNDTPGSGPGPLAAVLVSQPAAAFGTVSLAADGSVVFTPAAGAFGKGSFTYRASDGLSQSNLATVTLSLPPVPPSAADDAFTLPNLPPNSSAVVAPGVLANDTLNDAFTPLTAILVSQPGAAYGSVALAADGSFVFTPAAGAFGTGSFTYRASDGVSLSPVATVTLTLPPVPPSAADDAFTLPNPTPNQSTVAAPGVLANDTLNDAFTPLTAVLVSQPSPSFGSVALNADGSFTFTPAVSAFGTGSFTYRASDGVSLSPAATVTLTLPAPSVPPTAANDSFALPNLPTNPSTVVAPGVLANDTLNSGSGPLSAQLVSNLPAAFGTVVLNADGSFTVTPTATAKGSATFTYRAFDGFNVSADATVSVTLPPIPPSAVNDFFALPNPSPAGSTVVAPGVLANDAANDFFGPLAAVLVSQPPASFGTVALSANGSFTFTPAAGAGGTGSFTYRVSDGQTLSLSPATVVLSLPPVPPTANADAFTLPNLPPNPSTVVAPGVLGNDVANGNTPLSAQLESPLPSSFGTVALAADGSFVVTPAAGAFGTATFSYRASDGIALSAPVTVAVTLPPVPPTAKNDAFVLANPAPAGSTVVAPGVLANDTPNDASGPLTAVLVTPPPASFGTVSLAADGSFAFTPAPGAAGTASFTYRATDGVSQSDPATVALTLPVPVLAPVVNLTAVGAGAGGPSLVTVFNPDGSVRFQLTAFEPDFLGGVRVAVGDATGDGTDDVFAAAGTGGGPRVAVFDGQTGLRIADFFTFEPEFRGGLHIASADTDGDGRAEAVVGAGSTPSFSGGPRVAAIDPLTRNRTADFFAFDESFRGGVRVAAADLDSDGVAEIVAVAGPSGGPHVRVFSGAGADRGSVFAFDPAYRGGAFLAASAGRIFVTPDSVPTSAGTVYGDFFDSFPDTGGSLPGGGATGLNVSARPQVFVFNASTGVPSPSPSQIVDVFEPTFLGGVRVAFGESNGQPGLYAAAGTGGGGRVRFFPLGLDLATAPAFEFMAFNGTRSVYVGAGASPSGEG